MIELISNLSLIVFGFFGLNTWKKERELSLIEGSYENFHRCLDLIYSCRMALAEGKFILGFDADKYLEDYLQSQKSHFDALIANEWKLRLYGKDELADCIKNLNFQISKLQIAATMVNLYDKEQRDQIHKDPAKKELSNRIKSHEQLLGFNIDDEIAIAMSELTIKFQSLAKRRVQPWFLFEFPKKKPKGKVSHL